MGMGGGGGVLLASKSNIIHEPIATPTQLEMTATKIHLNNNKHIIIAAIYLPPNSDLQYIDDMWNTIEDLTSRHKTLYSGWEATSTGPTAPYKDTHTMYTSTNASYTCFSQPTQNKWSQLQPDKTTYSTSSSPIDHPPPHNATQYPDWATTMQYMFTHQHKHTEQKLYAEKSTSGDMQT